MNFSVSDFILFEEGKSSKKWKKKDTETIVRYTFSIDDESFLVQSEVTSYEENSWVADVLGTSKNPIKSDRFFFTISEILSDLINTKKPRYLSVSCNFESWRGKIKVSRDQIRIIDQKLKSIPSYKITSSISSNGFGITAYKENKDIDPGIRKQLR